MIINLIARLHCGKVGNLSAFCPISGEKANKIFADYPKGYFNREFIL